MYAYDVYTVIHIAGYSGSLFITWNRKVKVDFSCPPCSF
jgi:hypothetical protein